MALPSPAQAISKRANVLAGVLAWAAASALLAACGPEVAQPIGSEAEALYQEGMEHLAGGSILEAEQELQKLVKMPSYVQLTALARLRLADALYQSRKYDEAIEAYHGFVRRHEGNENVPYAMFMIAKSHYELAPSDLWILPPVYELDLSPVQHARVELEKFVRTYPRSRFATEALTLRDRCINLQYAHARYVVNFYAERGKWIGVVYRLHLAMQAFPDRAHTLAHYELLAKAYEKLFWRQRAVEMWQAVAQRWPQSPSAAQAPGEIQRIQADIEAAAKVGTPGGMPADAPPTAAIKPETMGQGDGA
ncbi:MAG: outer membrane protein assembly factor BamD [Deltaproteobacteria bacterium]|nr:outer membrane protein assembly factor BamD [Deltaproteobacteria bacterium]